MLAHLFGVAFQRLLLLLGQALHAEGADLVEQCIDDLRVGGTRWRWRRSQIRLALVLAS